MLLISLAATPSGCRDQEKPDPAKEATSGTDAAPEATPKYVHAVYFKCKPGTSEGEIDALIDDGYELLAKVPSVRRIDSGRRDVNADRDVNVTDYDVGLVVYFDDRAGHDLYADHPTHLEYVEKHKAHWETVRVFDFVAR